MQAPPVTAGAGGRAFLLSTPAGHPRPMPTWPQGSLMLQRSLHLLVHMPPRLFFLSPYSSFKIGTKDILPPWVVPLETMPCTPTMPSGCLSWAHVALLGSPAPQDCLLRVCAVSMAGR